MLLSHNVTGAVIIISRVLSRGRFGEDGRERVTVELGMLIEVLRETLQEWLIISRMIRQHKPFRLSERLSRVEKLLKDNFSGDGRMFHQHLCFVVVAN